MQTHFQLEQGHRQADLESCSMVRINHKQEIHVKEKIAFYYPHHFHSSYFQVGMDADPLMYVPIYIDLRPILTISPCSNGPLRQMPGEPLR